MISLLKSYRLPSVADSTARTMYFLLLLAITFVLYITRGRQGIFPSGGFGTWCSVSIILVFQIFYNNRFLWLILLGGSAITALSAILLVVIRSFMGQFEMINLLIFTFATAFAAILLLLKPRTSGDNS